jgi:hypothetical protein
VITKAKFRREIEHKFHQVDIKKRGTSFQPMRHGCPVDFDQNIAWQITTHIEVNGSIQAFGSGRRPVSRTK